MQSGNTIARKSLISGTGSSWAVRPVCQRLQKGRKLYDEGRAGSFWVSSSTRAAAWVCVGWASRAQQVRTRRAAIGSRFRKDLWTAGARLPVQECRGLRRPAPSMNWTSEDFDGAAERARQLATPEAFWQAFFERSAPSGSRSTEECGARDSADANPAGCLSTASLRGSDLLLGALRPGRRGRGLSLPASGLRLVPIASGPLLQPPSS
jgi:hypothetical protein